MTLKNDKNSIVSGIFFKKIRKSFNYTQLEVAMRAELSIRHYQSIENGSVTCRVDTLEKILAIYNYTFFNFFDECIKNEFHSKGVQAVDSLLDKELYRFLVTDSNGLVIDYSKDAGSWSGYRHKDVVGNHFYIWDFVEKEFEKKFLKAGFKLVSLLQPHPIPWIGHLKQKEGKSLKVKVYWKYILLNNQFNGIELIAIRI
jgi:transcriptional regulator with XRE-family HTH domain